ETRAEPHDAGAPQRRAADREDLRLRVRRGRLAPAAARGRDAADERLERGRTARGARVGADERGVLAGREPGRDRAADHAGEAVGQLALLALVTEPRREVLVDLLQLLLVGRREELAARPLGDRLQRLRIRRHLDALDVAAGELAVDDAVGRAERDGEDRHV